MKLNNSKNKRGSIMSALMAGLLIMGAIYFIVRQNTENKRKTLTMKIDQDVNVVTNRVFEQLSDPFKCRLTFGASLKPKFIVSAVDSTIPTALKIDATANKQGKILWTVGNAPNTETYGNDSVSISSYELVDSNPYQILHIYFSNPNPLVKPIFHRTIKMAVKWNPAPPNLIDCKAITDSDQIWSLATTATGVYTSGIYYKAWTGIGMGTDATPATKSTFDILGDVKIAQPKDTCVAPAVCPASTLTPKTTARVTAVDFRYVSDQRLKTNVEDIVDPLQKALDLRGVSFRWRDGGKEDYGFIAQEVQTTLPEIIKEDDAQQLSVMVEAVKQQQAQIDTLKAEVRRLRR